MQSGRVAEIGTHDTLMAENTLYRRMWLTLEGSIDSAETEPESSRSTAAAQQDVNHNGDHELGERAEEQSEAAFTVK